MKDAITIREVAQRLGIAEQTVRRLIHSGDLPHVRISERRIIIPISVFEKWLNERAKRG